MFSFLSNLNGGASSSKKKEEDNKNNNNNNTNDSASFFSLLKKKEQIGLNKKRMVAKNPADVHGFLCDELWPLPYCAVESTESNRADQGNHTSASEYLDEPEVLEKKMELVAQLIKKSKFCGAYTGAGLSRASGIPDYASKASNSIVNTVPENKNPLEAQPTIAHCYLTALYKKGYVKWYVQQNHDGLPQKSGFPQSKVNEIHGAWFDPSNPVVQFSGSLRSDLFANMLELEQKADLSLVLGTSLSGMNADRMGVSPAKRSLKKQPTSEGHPTLGTVLINIQQTHLDSKCAVRVWGKLDDAFAILAKKLDLQIQEQKIPAFPSDMKFKIPYDRKGRYNPDYEMTLDMSDNAQVQIPIKGAMNYKAEGKIFKYTPKRGVWTVELNEPRGGDKTGTRLVHRAYGWWWIDEALRGEISQLPVINLNPVVKKKKQKTTNTNNNNNNNNNNKKKNSNSDNSN